MAAGFLQGSNLSNANQEWVIDFCKFRDAWILPLPPGGKAKGEGIYVGHPDTGTTNHPELMTSHYVRDRALSKNFLEPLKLASLSAIRNAEFTTDDLLTGFFPSHGTGTASVIVSPIGHPNGADPGPAATFPSESPSAFVSGVAPLANVIPFRVTENVMLNEVTDQALVNCIDYCIALQNRNPPIDVAVISVSLGRPISPFTNEKKVRRALREARLRGIVICAAAGQAFENAEKVIDPVFPGSDPNTICVGACTSSFGKFLAGFHGPAIDITAPGVDIWHARSRFQNARLSAMEFIVQGDGYGTSYATAITAGACALWQAHHGRQNLIANYGRENIFKLFKHCLQESSTKWSPQSWDSQNRGAGVLDAELLLRFLLPSKSFVESLPDS